MSTNKNNKIIDIIIPAYKAQDTIDRTLASIATQTFADKIQVTIVNDKDGIGYKKYINRYKDMVDIQEIELTKNGGPGVARQIGLVRTKLPYVTFVDADDTFYNSFSVQIMLTQLTHDPKVVVSIGEFFEQRKKDELEFIQHEKDTIWMFGKMYKRDFLNRYQIQFNETRSNEDTGFNQIMNLCANENEKINFYTNPVYIWWFKEDSITRINNFEYTYNQSFVGYTQNMIYAIQHVRHVQPFNKKVDLRAIEIMSSLYIYFMKTKFRDNRWIDQNFGQCKIYYDTIFKEIMSRIPLNHITKIVAKKLAEETPSMPDIVIDMTFYQFIEMLEKEEVVKEEEKNNVDEKQESEVIENG